MLLVRVEIDHDDMPEMINGSGRDSPTARSKRHDPPTGTRCRVPGRGRKLRWGQIHHLEVDMKPCQVSGQESDPDLTAPLPHGLHSVDHMRLEAPEVPAPAVNDSHAVAVGGDVNGETAEALYLGGQQLRVAQVNDRHLRKGPAARRRDVAAA